MSRRGIESSSERGGLWPLQGDIMCVCVKRTIKRMREREGHRHDGYHHDRRRWLLI